MNLKIPMFQLLVLVRLDVLVPLRNLKKSMTKSAHNFGEEAMTGKMASRNLFVYDRVWADCAIIIQGHGV